MEIGKIAKCKGQKFGHNYIGGKCTECNGSQNHINQVVKKVEDKDFLAKLAERAKEKAQATYHQHLAAETAELLGDLKSIGIYLRLFKRYDHGRLLVCRDWVIKNGKGNKGRLFVSVYKKFLGLEKI